MPDSVPLVGEAVLEVVSPDGARRYARITQTPFMIGRGAETGNHLQLSDRRISRNCVAVLKLAAFDFFAVDEKTAALAAILDVEAIGFDDDGGAVAGDAAVGELQVVTSLGASADHEGCLRDAGIAARAVGGDDFENGFAS